MAEEYGFDIIVATGYDEEEIFNWRYIGTIFS